MPHIWHGKCDLFSKEVYVMNIPAVVLKHLQYAASHLMERHSYWKEMGFSRHISYIRAYNLFPSKEAWSLERIRWIQKRGNGYEDFSVKRLIQWFFLTMRNKTPWNLKKEAYNMNFSADMHEFCAICFLPNSIHHVSLKGAHTVFP